MAYKMNTWQSLGLQGNHHTLPDQSNSSSIIVFNEITSSPPPSFSVMGLVQGKDLEILLPLTHRCHEMIYFGTADDLLQSWWRLVDDIHWWTFYYSFIWLDDFFHMTHSISILASSFLPLLFIFLKWSFIHSLTPIFAQPFFPSFPISILHLMLCYSTDAAFCLAISNHFIILLCDVYKGLFLHL